ncbi:MAG: DUF4340 domain-containing protein, partial [bacterium]
AISNAPSSGAGESVTWIWPPDTNHLVRVRRDRALDEWWVSERDWRAALVVGEGRTWRDALAPAAYRKRVLLAIPSSDIHRVTRWSDGLEETLVCERGSWTVQSPAGGRVSREAVAAMTNWLAALSVVRFEHLDAGRLAGAGLERPALRLAIGLTGASGIEKNLVLGGETGGGVYAAVHGQDDVAVIPVAAAEALRRDIVTW